MDVIIVIAIILVLLKLVILNIYEGIGVFVDGWIGRSFSVLHYVYDENDIPEITHKTSFKSWIMWFLTLPGAVLGFIVGIITFQWLHW